MKNRICMFQDVESRKTKTREFFLKQKKFAHKDSARFLIKSYFLISWIRTIYNLKLFGYFKIFSNSRNKSSLFSIMSSSSTRTSYRVIKKFKSLMSSHLKSIYSANLHVSVDFYSHAFNWWRRAACSFMNKFKAQLMTRKHMTRCRDNISINASWTIVVSNSTAAAISKCASFHVPGKFRSRKIKKFFGKARWNAIMKHRFDVNFSRNEQNAHAKVISVSDKLCQTVCFSRTDISHMSSLRWKLTLFFNETLLLKIVSENHAT